MSYTNNSARETFSRISGIVGYEIDRDIWNTWASALNNAGETCIELGVLASCDAFGTPSDEFIRHTLGTLESVIADGYPGAEFFAEFGITA
jgi:hypothetical protein